MMSIGEPQVWQQNRRGCSSRFDMPMRQLVGSPQVSHSTLMLMFTVESHAHILANTRLSEVV